MVLLSGTGSLFQSLLDASRSPSFPAEIVAVGSELDHCQGLQRASAAGLPTFTVSPQAYRHPDRHHDRHLDRHHDRHDGGPVDGRPALDREAWDRALASSLGAWDPDWIVCAGFMRILGPAVLAQFDGRIINSHPALLPAFPGAHAVADALAAGAATTGCTVHLVDAGVDTGPVLAQCEVAVHVEDNEATLHERIKTVERELLPEVLADLVLGRLCAPKVATRSRSHS